MSSTTPNPFPLNIENKQDSWEKLQLLLNIDPKLKLTAAEFNKIISALNYIYNSNGNPDNFLGTYATYALFIAANPLGEVDQYAFVYEDENQVAGTFIYIWNDTSHQWEQETDTSPQGAVLMNIQGDPFSGLASLFFRFDTSQFTITQIQGGGIGITLKNSGPGGGIPEPTNDGSWERKKTGNTFSWVRAGIGVFKLSGTYNPATDVPPIQDGTHPIVKGDSYSIVADGDFYGVKLRAGDVIMAAHDYSTAAGHWIQLQGVPSSMKEPTNDGFFGRKKTGNTYSWEAILNIDSKEYETNTITFKNNTSGDYFGTLATPRTGALTFQEDANSKRAAVSSVWYQNPTLDIPSSWTVQGDFDAVGINKLYIERAAQGVFIVNIINNKSDTPDTTKPVVQSVEIGNVDANTLVMTYDEPLQAVAVGVVTSLGIHLNGGVIDINPTTISVSGTKVTAIFAQAIISTDVVTYEYFNTWNLVKDLAGNKADGNLIPLPVINNVGGVTENPSTNLTLTELGGVTENPSTNLTLTEQNI